MLPITALLICLKLLRPQAQTEIEAFRAHLEDDQRPVGEQTRETPAPTRLQVEVRPSKRRGLARR